MTFQKSLYVIMITDQFEDKRRPGIFKHQAFFEADPNFEIVVAKLSQPSSFVKVRLAHKALGVCDPLTYA